MGRCYEFGASITDGCEHAMAVGPEGGYCVCAACGARCEGRFRACAAILARPGYVPVSAPKVAPSAARTVDRPTAPVEDEAKARPRARFSLFGGPPEAETPNDRILQEFRQMLTTVLERHAEAMEAIAAVDATVGARDLELITAFKRLSEGYAQLTAEVQASHQELAELAEAVVSLAARVDRGPGPRALHG